MKDLPLKARILWATIALLAAFNIIRTATDLPTIYDRKKNTAFHFTGDRFTGIEKALKNEKYVGYYTDQKIDDTRPMMELLQAQHNLIPLILDPQNIDHRFVIVNCANIPAAAEKFKTLGARPLSKVHNGIFVVERPSRL